MGDTATSQFLTLRPRLFAVAYRMLGSVSDAEDIVQDAFLRWQGAQQDTIRDATGYLIRIVTNLCLDRLRTAQKQREAYPGEWLPEPIVTDDMIERTDHDVSVALLLVMERLTPLERAAYLLRDVFDTDYTELASVLSRSPAACRQLVARARTHVHAARPRSIVPPKDGEAMAVAFFKAARTGDREALTRMLADDAQLVADGGGKVLAARRVIRGRDHLVRFFAGIAAMQGNSPPAKWRACQINRLPAIISLETAGDLIQTTALEISEGRVTRVYIVRNPDKTAHLAPHLI